MAGKMENACFRQFLAHSDERRVRTFQNSRGMKISAYDIRFRGNIRQWN